MDTEQRLSGVLSEFAHTLVTDFPIQAILDHLVVRVVDVLPISAAGVTLIAPGSAPHHVASSDALGLQFEQLQTELDEGPCLAACAAGLAIAVPDLRGDDRFPTFARRALADGLAAVFTFPQWHRHPRAAEVNVFVNVSAHQLTAGDFAAEALAVLAATGTDPARVTLEITESAFVHDKVRVRTTLDTLEAAGLRLALDDFGTGHASLRDLGEFPVAIVKIDRDFVNDLRRDPASRLIVEAIVGLAHDLELAVIAEGIETAEQYDDAVAVGCDHCQGFFLASPKRAEVVGELFEHASFPWTGRPAATGVRR